MKTRFSMALVFVVACSRSSATSDAGTQTSASAAPSASAPEAPVASAPPKAREVSAASFSPIEAKRTRIAKLEEDRALAANADAVKAHFGGTLPARLAVQTAELPASHRR